MTGEAGSARADSLAVTRYNLHMAGYSGTPLDQKLGIKPGHRIAALNAPPGVLQTLNIPGIEPDADWPPYDVILYFTESRDAYEKDYESLKAALQTNGGLWICWPKRASGVPTDLTEDIIRNHALANGLVDNKVCAVDETWSGLRLVRRLKDR